MRAAPARVLEGGDESGGVRFGGVGGRVRVLPAVALAAFVRLAGGVDTQLLNLLVRRPRPN